MKNEIDASMIAKSMKVGNIEVLLQWIDSNKQKLYRMSWSYLKNNTDVEDVFHNTIIKVVENINKRELPPLIEVDGFLVNTTTVASLPKLSRSFQPL